MVGICHLSGGLFMYIYARNWFVCKKVFRNADITDSQKDVVQYLWAKPTACCCQKEKAVLQPLHCTAFLPIAYFMGAWNLLNPSVNFLNSLGEEIPNNNKTPLQTNK